MRHTNPHLPALLACAVLATLGTGAAAEDVPTTVVLIGDSYISSHGVERGKSFANQLQAALDAAKVAVHVVDTGYTGTSVAGAQTIDKRLAAPDGLGAVGPKAVIVELGQNDCFSSFQLQKTRANLDQLLARFAEAGIPALVVGTTPYEYCERGQQPSYKSLYVPMFAELADKYGDLYYRDFKDGVNGHLDLMQGDQDHPTAEGDAVIVANMLPVIKDLIARATLP